MNLDQFGRKFGLILASTSGKVKDFSEFRVVFDIQNADRESPNNAVIRIYGLSRTTIKELIQNDEYQLVTVGAGYTDGNYGMIFSGNIKQYRHGKEDATSMYLDILAADGAKAYEQAFLSSSVAAGAGSSNADDLNAVAKASGLTTEYGVIKSTNFFKPSIRGKVRFGLARMYARNAARSSNCGWSIQNGVLTVIDNSGYRRDEIVVLNSASGLIGIPEQTDEGIRLTCLLNSKIQIGDMIRIDNNLINSLDYAANSTSPTPYNKRVGLQPLAPLIENGLYRVLVAEHEGDTRGNNWYTHIIGLAMDEATKTVIEFPKQLREGVVTIGDIIPL